MQGLSFVVDRLLDGFSTASASFFSFSVHLSSSMPCKEISYLDVYRFLWLTYYFSKVSNDWQVRGADSLDLVFPSQLTS